VSTSSGGNQRTSGRKIGQRSQQFYLCKSLGIVAVSATKTKELYPTPGFRQKEVTRSNLEEKVKTWQKKPNSNQKTFIDIVNALAYQPSQKIAGLPKAVRALRTNVREYLSNRQWQSDPPMKLKLA